MMDPWAAAASHGTAVGIELALIRNKIFILKNTTFFATKAGFFGDYILVIIEA